MKGNNSGTNDMKSLQKLAIPLAFSLAGIILSTITKPHSSDHGEEMDSQDFTSHDDLGNEELEEGQPSMRLQASASVETLQVQGSESTREISVEEFDNGFNAEEEIDAVRSLAVGIQDRECELESQFYNYCSTKEQEGAYQKLQIMCLGLKLESLESQNQRLEGQLAEFREAVEQMTSMREEIKLLRRKANKLSKRNAVYLKIAAKKDAEVSEAIQAAKEIREVAEQLRMERKLISERLGSRPPADPLTSKDDVECMMSGTAESTKLNNRFLLHLEQIQDQWSARIEELIYLAWINSCLRHEVLRNQQEEAKPVQEIRNSLVVELPVEAITRSCSIEFYDSDGPSIIEDRGEEVCMAIESRKQHAGLAKPRLLCKLKGWAKRKVRCKKEREGKTLERGSVSSRDVEDHVIRNSC